MSFTANLRVINDRGVQGMSPVMISQAITFPSGQWFTHGTQIALTTEYQLLATSSVTNPAYIFIHAAGLPGGYYSPDIIVGDGTNEFIRLRGGYFCFFPAKVDVYIKSTASSSIATYAVFNMDL